MPSNHASNHFALNNELALQLSAVDVKNAFPRDFAGKPLIGSYGFKHAKKKYFQNSPCILYYHSRIIDIPF